MSGFFKIWRDLFEKPIWLKSTPEQKVILIALIKMANWKDAKWEWQGKPYCCKPGEFITSYNSIIKACGKGVTYQNVRTAIKRFKNFDFLTYQITIGEYGGIKVILNNWDRYQNEINISSNSSLTVRQQFANSSLTPIEEEEERKKNNLSLYTRARVGKRERDILISFCKRNKIKNKNAYIRKIIDNGDWVEILKEEEQHQCNTRKKIEELKKFELKIPEKINESPEVTERAFKRFKQNFEKIRRGNNGNEAGNSRRCLN